MSSVGSTVASISHRSATKSLRPMLCIASGDHLAGRDVGCGEQIQDPLPYVAVDPSFGLPAVHRHDRLRPLQRLNLGLLVDREGRRGLVRAAAGECRRLRSSPRAAAQAHLESLGAMRLQPEHPPDAADHRMTDAGRLGHGPSARVRLAGRRRVERLHNDGFNLLIADGARRPDGGSSYSPTSRRATNWLRHFATVVFVVRRRRATAVSEASTHDSTIRVRNATARFTRARFCADRRRGIPARCSAMSSGVAPAPAHSCGGGPF
jgi:hypothetical protein